MPSSLTNAKLSLLRVAKQRLALDEESYRDILLRYGGARSARDLDGWGFDKVMDRFRALGFESDFRKRSYGDRIGMASDGQVAMIRELFREVAADPTDDHLNAWLEKMHKVSSLRFVTSDKAGKIIAALKAWRSRGPNDNHA